MRDRPFYSGLVEGFYGRQWSWQNRREMVLFMARLGMNSYLYCPKGDAYLRRQWSEDWPPSDRQELLQLAASCRQNRIAFGVGLSPFALYQDYSATARRLLQQRILQIQDLGGELLAILFDDMPGDVADLAERQAEIITDIQSWAPDMRLLACPTYYSFDPQLEQYFGAMPRNYWRQLGTGLPVEVDIFWTGNSVCSESITVADIQRIVAELGRAPVLWDNYPVNDGKKASNHLHLRQLSGRESALAELLSGHFCNPMNQPWLSRAGLLGLSELYHAGGLVLADLYGDELAECLLRDVPDFQDRGLLQMSAADKRQLRACYTAIDHPAAAEVVAWLDGEYQFDPACLTA
jgi:hyaluronoglucosaminidase